MEEDYPLTPFDTVRLKRGDIQVKFLASQVTTTAVSRVFNVSADTVWLRDSISSQVILANNQGEFTFTDSGVLGSTFFVEGSADSKAKQQNQRGSNNIQVKESSGISLPVNNISYKGNYQSTLPGPSFKSILAKKVDAGTTIRIVKAKMSLTKTGKVNFDNEAQVYVEVKESTANVPYITTYIQNQFGDQYILV